MTQIDRKGSLINSLADFLMEDIGNKSILLKLSAIPGLENRYASLALGWSDLFTISGAHSFKTKDDAVKTLTELLK